MKPSRTEPHTPEKVVYGALILSLAQDIIHVLMEFSRTETGHLQVECEPTDVPRLVGEVAEDYRGAAEAAGIHLGFEAAESLYPIETDAARVRQIRGNLLSNAVKYAQGVGQITGRVGVRSGGKAPGPGNWLVIDVGDNGPGIAPKEHERIFDEFHRVNAGAQAGTGLGLAISRRIARLLGGDITLRSTPGEGATFSLWLPLERESASSIAPAA